MILHKKLQHSAVAITLEEFCQKCQQLGPIARVSDYEKVIPLLAQLKQNKQLLVDFFLAEIASDWQLQQRNSYSVQSFFLASNDLFEIRMNCWPSLKDCNYDRAQFMKDNFYLLAHDHNYHFITLGLHGPGYVTDIFEYDINRVDHNNCVGQDVEMDYTGRFNLADGDIMIYEANKHIHIQYPPDEMSISINIVPHQPKRFEQYEFDLKNSKIIRPIVNDSSHEILRSIISSLEHQALSKEYDYYLTNSNSMIDSA